MKYKEELFNRLFHILTQHFYKDYNAISECYLSEKEKKQENENTKIKKKFYFNIELNWSEYLDSLIENTTDQIDITFEINIPSIDDFSVFDPEEISVLVTSTDTEEISNKLIEMDYSLLTHKKDDKKQFIEEEIALFCKIKKSEMEKNILNELIPENTNILTNKIKRF